MPSPRVLATLPLVLAAGLAACGDSGSTTAGTDPLALEDGGDGAGQASAVGDGASTRLTAELSGGAEVPDHGDPDGRGRATVVVVPGRSQLCYRIEVEAVADVD